MTDTLRATFEGLLADAVPGGRADLRTDAQASFAEDDVLTELRAAMPSVTIPANFEAHFRTGAGGKPRFLELFGAFFSEQIKPDTPARAIMTAKLLARIEGLAFHSTEILYRIEKQFAADLAAIRKGVSDIQDKLDQQNASIEKFAGVTQALVDALGENKDLSKRLAAANVDKAKVMVLAWCTAQTVEDFDQALRELENHASVAIEVLREGRGGHNLGAFVKAVLARIRARYDANDFDAAAAEASQGFDAWRQRETERRAEAAQAGLKILNAGLRQDILRLDPAAAAERIELIAGIEAPEDAAALLRALRTKYDDWPALPRLKCSPGLTRCLI